MKPIHVILISLFVYLSLEATPLQAAPTSVSIENQSSWKVRFRFKYADGSTDGNWTNLETGTSKSRTSLDKSVAGVQVRFLDFTDWKSINNMDNWSQDGTDWSYLVKGRIPQKISIESRATATAGVNGSYKALPGNWGGTEAITSAGSYIYAVQGGKLWRSTAAGGYTDLGGGWGGTEAMASMGGDLFLVQGGHLWRKTPGNSTRTDLGANWGGTEAMTSLGNYLYAVQGGKLWRFDSNGKYTDLGSGWSGTEALTSAGGYLYAVQGGKLWRTDTNGKSVELGSNWGGTAALASVNSHIYALQGGKLWHYDPSTKRSEAMKTLSSGQVRDTDWSLPGGMTSLNGHVFILQGGKLWDAWMY
jgi:hypothetical protein